MLPYESVDAAINIVVRGDNISDPFIPIKETSNDGIDPYADCDDLSPFEDDTLGNLPYEDVDFEDKNFDSGLDDTVMDGVHHEKC